MNSLAKIITLILVFQDSTCFDLTEVNSKVKKAQTNFSYSNFLNSIRITTEGILDLSGLDNTLNININVTSILASLNVRISDDGLLNLEPLISNLYATKQINLTDVLSLLNVDVLDNVVNLKNLALKMVNINFTQIVDSFPPPVATEDGILDFVGLAEKYIGNVMEYDVTTEDGYILKLYRIPGKGPTVLLSHGILDTSDGFISRGNTSLAYILAKKGYDVWVMNYRGNRYSRTHTTLNPDTDKQYWQFSMQEKGYYDLAAVIDFTLETTGRDKLNTIGHSQGTATVFVLTSLRPEYNSKINLFIALSPVCYLSDSGFGLRTLVTVGQALNEILLVTGTEELMGYYTRARRLLYNFCLLGSVGYDVCFKLGLSSLFGYNPDNIGQDYWPTLVGHYPDGGSRKEFNHYIQIGNKDLFGQYDYGPRNIEVYGSETIPIYDLKNVSTNVSLVIAKNDGIFGLTSGNRLRNELPNVVDYYVIDDERFEHMDYTSGQNANETLHPYIIEMLDLYN